MKLLFFTLIFNYLTDVHNESTKSNCTYMYIVLLLYNQLYIIANYQIYIFESNLYMYMSLVDLRICKNKKALLTTLSYLVIKLIKIV